MTSLLTPERMDRIRSIQNMWRANAGGGHSDTADALCDLFAAIDNVSALVADFKARDYDEPGLQELLAELDSILNPKA